MNILFTVCIFFHVMNVFFAYAFKKMDAVDIFIHLVSAGLATGSVNKDVNVTKCYILGTVLVITMSYADVWREHVDDCNVFCFLIPLLYHGFEIFCRCGLQVVCKHGLRMYWSVQRHGWIRWLVYFLCVVCFSYVFVVIIADGSLLFVLRTLKGKAAAEFDNNIIEVEEQRPVKDTFSFVSYTGDNYGFFSFQPTLQDGTYSRYQMEDAKFECSNFVVWVSFSPPDEDLLTFKWKRNGKEFPWSARYHQNTKVEEFKDNDHTLSLLAQANGLAVYRVNVTLQIRLLKAFDFGNYTCEGIDIRHFPLALWQRFAYSLFNLVLQPNELLTSAIKISKPGNLTNSHLMDHEDGHWKLRHLFQIVNGYIDQKTQFIWDYLIKVNIIQAAMATFGIPKLKFKLQALGYFRLIEFKKKTILVSAAPGAILMYRTFYFQTENERSDIINHFYINGRPLFGGNFTSAWDCSKTLLMYWVFVKGYTCFFHASQSYCEVPPFRSEFHFIAAPEAASIPQVVFCLGPQTFGRLQVEFYRDYFNVKTKRYESVIAHHPNDLVIEPQRQTLFENIFFNQPSAHALVNMSLGHESDFPNDREVSYMLKAADVLSSHFMLTEGLCITFAAFLTLLIVYTAFMCTVKYVGYFLKWWILDRPALNTNRIIERNPIFFDWINRFSRTVFHFYLSFADSDMPTIQDEVLPFIENLGFEVCFRERDVPPNMQEVDAVDMAVTNSRRYVVFLSPHYLSDGLRLNLEAKAIMDAANSKGDPSSALLVVKLGHCDVPGWLRFFPLHDWTASNLNRDDHLSRLYQWVKPASQRDWRQECVHLVCPALLIVLFLLAALGLKTYFV